MGRQGGAEPFRQDRAHFWGDLVDRRGLQFDPLFMEGTQPAGPQVGCPSAGFPNVLRA